MHDDASGVLIETARMAVEHIARRRTDPVTAPFDRAALQGEVQAFDFAARRDHDEVVATLFDLLRRTGVRSDHPGYFGLFNPAALIPAIAGDLVAATVSPQLAAWEHAPAAAEIEQHLVALFANRIWGAGEAAGTFTSGAC